LYCFSLYENIRFVFKTSLLSCIRFQIGGGGLTIAFFGWALLYKKYHLATLVFSKFEKHCLRQWKKGSRC
jgi:hypothetical protein